jgi:hypothetical protein
MYTPGLAVRAYTTIQRTRRLPIKGKTMVSLGERVMPDAIIARAELAGFLQSVKVSNKLGVDPTEAKGMLTVAIGDTVEKGQIVARSKGFFGFFPAEAKAGATGTVEIFSDISGNLGIREAPTPIDVTAYISGEIVEVLEGEGAVIETKGALVQGIFGVGGERRAPIMVVSHSPESILSEENITSACAGKLLLGGANLTGAALKKAAEIGVLGIVVGGMIDKDLIDFLGYDIGVAITGHEDIPLTLILTEGFGTIAMARRTYDLLASLAGHEASFSGATQIRAGVIRPEIIVSDAPFIASTDNENAEGALAIGTQIRIIREPYFGKLATVTALPYELTRLESGTEVRVLRATLQSEDKGEVTVPRANVELIL